MLADKLFQLESFKRQFKSIQILSSVLSIDGINPSNEKQKLISEIDWNNILGISSVLSYSDDSAHLDAALRIGQTVLVEKTTSETQKEAAAFILLNLTNKPAINLAIKRGLVRPDFLENLPFILNIRKLAIDFENSVIIADKALTTNKFQSRVYQGYVKNDTLSISAPTSAGKSFILCSIIVDVLIKGKKNIIYVVPTRALISQVERDLTERIKEYNLSSVNISTVPQEIEDNNNSNIFVFTQERLHWFLVENLHFTIDILIIDEAQKIEDKYRGILLQHKIEDVISLNPNVKVYFSSPFTSNPEILLENLSKSREKDTVNTQFVSVNQNLLFVTQKPKDALTWEVSLCAIEDNMHLGNIELIDRASNDKKKMAYIALALAKDSLNNIIYANGAAAAEDIALVLHDCLPKPEQIPEGLANLISLAKKTIHSEYRLAMVLEKGIAFHYGNMPLLIRQEIESLFRKGDIKFLVCTSTLLEGVNLPAKSIFIMKPRRGKTNPLNPTDFWNLAGRAGRWGKEFSGNIVCINPDEWENKPNANKSQQKISRAVDIVKEKSDELISFIEAGSPRAEAESRQELEFAFGYFYIKFLEKKLLEENPVEKKLKDVFYELQPRIKVPDYIIKRNPGISPIAQQELLDYFADEKKDVIESVVPVLPEDVDAYQEYIKLISRIGKTLAKYPSAISAYRAILILNWISGKPLSYIIRQTADYYKKKKSKKSIHAVIRDVMNDIESFARFRFAKDSSCYIDILRYYLEVCGRNELIKKIPNLNLWLEFGVSQKTHLSLLALGLSRNSVIEITEFATNSTMSKIEAGEWLKRLDLTRYDFPRLVKEEVQNLISNLNES